MPQMLRVKCMCMFLSLPLIRNIYYTLDIKHSIQNLSECAFKKSLLILASVLTPYRRRFNWSKSQPIQGLLRASLILDMSRHPAVRKEIYISSGIPLHVGNSEAEKVCHCHDEMLGNYTSARGGVIRGVWSWGWDGTSPITVAAGVPTSECKGLGSVVWFLPSFYRSTPSVLSASHTRLNTAGRTSHLETRFYLLWTFILDQ